MTDIHRQTGQPVGRSVDSRPAQRPAAVRLPGRYGAVERLEASKHDASLWNAVRGHDELWTYMAYGSFADEGAFSGWLASRATLVDPYYYAIVEPSGCSVRSSMA